MAKESYALQVPDHRADYRIARWIRKPSQHIGYRRLAELEDNVHDLTFAAPRLLSVLMPFQLEEYVAVAFDRFQRVGGRPVWLGIQTNRQRVAVEGEDSVE